MAFVFPYFLFPLVSGFTWIGMLIAMIVVWSVEGFPHYPSMGKNQRIAYISDIGAQGLKPLFIAGCCVTTIFLDLAFAAERWLRHTGMLARNYGMAEKILSGLSIIFAIGGTCGLILLSIFDTAHHPKLHDVFLLLFIAGYIISAIFICAEYQRLGVHYRQHRILRLSFWMKLAFILVELSIAIAFAATTFTKHQNIAAVLEWIIAFIFTFYVLTFFIDLYPALKMKQSDLYDHSASDNNGTNGTNRQEMGYTNGEGSSNEGYYTNGIQSGTRNSRYYADGAVPQPKPIAGQNF